MRSALRFIGITVLVMILGVAASLPVSFGIDTSSAGNAAIFAATACLCFILIPILIAKSRRTPLAAYGWRWPEVPRQAFALGALLFVPLAAVLVFFSSLPEFQSFYSLAGYSVPAQLLILFPISLAYYVAEEFLFRGFFFFALYRINAFGGYAMNALLFGILHVSKPPLEIAFAAAVAVAFCWLTRKTGSFVPAALLHFSLALFMNVYLLLVYPSAAGTNFNF